MRADVRLARITREAPRFVIQAKTVIQPVTCVSKANP